MSDATQGGDADDEAAEVPQAEPVSLTEQQREQLLHVSREWAENVSSMTSNLARELDAVIDNFRTQTSRWDFTPAIDLLRSQAQNLQAMQRFVIPKIVLPKLPEFDHAALREAAAAITRGFRKFLPPNWPDDWLDEEAMQVMEFGIPTAWVPRKEVLAKLSEADDYAAAERCLEKHRVEIIEDCRVVQAGLSVTDQTELIGAAIDALAAGHDASAQALASLVAAGIVEAYVGSSMRIKKHGPGVDKPGLKVGDEDTMEWFTVVFGWTPVLVFFQDTQSPAPLVPAELSRHALMHQAAPEQFTVANALTAVMLAVSAAKTVEEMKRLGVRHFSEIPGRDHWLSQR